MTPSHIDDIYKILKNRKSLFLLLYDPIKYIYCGNFEFVSLKQRTEPEFVLVLIRIRISLG